MRANAASRGAGTGAGQPEGSPRAEVAARLKAYAAGGSRSNWHKQPTSSKGKKGKKGNKGIISLNDSDDWDEKSPLSLDSVGGSDDWDEKSPLSLDSGGGTHRRNIQLYGVDAANRMKAGGGQPGGGPATQGGQAVQGGPSKAEQGFWGGPKFGDMQRFWLQMLGKTPSQAAGEDLAREAGYGRAVGHKKKDRKSVV